MGGMAKVQETITGRRWKRVSSTAIAGTLERKRGIPTHSSTQPAGQYHVWAAHITQAIRGSSKSTIKKLRWTIRKKQTPARWNARLWRKLFSTRLKPGQK